MRQPIKVASLISIIFLFCALSQILGIEGKRKPVIITGDNVKSKLVGLENGKKVYLTELTGNPKIKYSNNILRAKKIIIHGNGEKAEAIGNVVLIDKKRKTVVRSRRALYYKFKDMIEFTGNPTITTRREDDNSKVFVHAKRIKYDIKKNIGYAFTKVALKNRNTNIYSKRAIFHRSQRTAIFSGDPYIQKGKDIFKAEEIISHIDKRSTFLNKNAHAVTYSEKKDTNSGEIKSTRMIIKGDRIENYENEKLTIIIGNAFIEREDAIFTGNRIEIRGDEGDDVFGTNVNMNYRTENIEAYGETFRSNKKNGYSALWGKAFLIIKDELTCKESSRIYGDYMEYYPDIDELYVFDNVKILRDSGVIRGKMARYKRIDSDMFITGNAIIESESSILSSQKIIFNTKSNEIRMAGDIKGYSVD